MKDRILNLGALLSVVALVTACDSDSAVASPRSDSQRQHGESESYGPVPSARRLEAFLPDQLNNWPHTFDLGAQKRRARSDAKRQYKPGDLKFASGIDLEISFDHLEPYNRSLRFFNSGFGKHVEVAGFEAAIDEMTDMGYSRFNLHIRLSEKLWVKASGKGPFERIRDAALAIDLAGLHEALENGSLFEELEGDHLERVILSQKAMQALLPAKLGQLEQKSSGGRTFFSEDPMYSRARGKYGSGTLTIYDYGSPEIARAVERNIEESAILVGFEHHTDCVVEKEPLAVNDGDGEWTWTKNVKAPLQPALVVNLVRGRFLLEYAGLFVESQPLPESATPQMLAQAEKLNRDSGADTFESIEEQRDAILAFFEALDLAQPNH